MGCPVYKTYLYIEFKLESPLSIGSGLSNETDKDVVRNSKGEPFIPATSLAGVYSSFFDKKRELNSSESDLEKYFGYVDIETGNNNKKNEKNENPNRPQAKESPLIIYDGILCKDDSAACGIRHGVKLDEYRTSVTGSKYDFEVVYPGTSFWTAIEYTSSDSSIEPIHRIASAWFNNKITVGAKSTRGLGRLKCQKIKYKSFSLPDQLDSWLEFDIYAEDRNMLDWRYEEHSRPVCDNKIEIALTLRQRKASALTVRVYSTDVSSDSKVSPDYSQMAYWRKNSGQDEAAVIPGTSWAGSFRHNMARSLEKMSVKTGVDLSELFGMVKEERKDEKDPIARKSRIVFSETCLQKGEFKTISRTAIDRFSGGASDNALFTEKVYYGGSDGLLLITVPEDIEEDHLKALAISIADLHEGFLTVGGESSIGHGILEIEKVQVGGGEIVSKDNREINGEFLYKYIIDRVNRIKEKRNEGAK